VLTGTIGFYACYWFVRTIYASVKIDWGLALLD
jgi:transmembrane 9 superfamily protein 2/4